MFLKKKIKIVKEEQHESNNEVRRRLKLRRGLFSNISSKRLGKSVDAVLY